MLSLEESPAVIGGRKKGKRAQIADDDEGEEDEEENADGVLKAMHTTGDKSERKQSSQRVCTVHDSRLNGSLTCAPSHALPRSVWPLCCLRWQPEQ